MAQNRKISQFASYVAYDDLTTHIAITTTSSAPFVGIGSTVPEQKLTVAGNTYITGFITATSFYNQYGLCVDNVYQLDNISGGANGLDNTYQPTFDQEFVNVQSPFKLLITVNGTLQSAYSYDREYVWKSDLICSWEGYTVDYDGNIKFTEALPEGSQIVIKTVSGAIKPDYRKYPFRPLDIAY